MISPPASKTAAPGGFPAAERPDWQRLVQASKFRDWPFGQSGKGRIALQDHGDEVAFRNLRVKRL